MDNKPHPAPLSVDGLRRELIMVKQILELPVQEDSSALKLMDAWAIADYIAAALQSERQRIADSLPEKIPDIEVDDPGKRMDFDTAIRYAAQVATVEGWNAAIETVRAVLGGEKK